MNAHSSDFRPSLPDATDIEQAILGALMLNAKALVDVEDKVTADDFGEPLHARIFEVVTDLIRTGKRATPQTVIGFMPDVTMIGDMTIAQYLALLASEAIKSHGIEGLAEAVRDMAVRRRLVSAGDSIRNIAYNAQPDETGHELVGKAQELLFEIEVRDGGDGMMTAQQEADRMMSGERKVARPTVPLPFPQLEEVMGECLEAGNLYGMLSGSGEGKTSAVLQIIRHAAEQGHPVLFLSYDQLWDQCLLQMVSQRLGILHARLKDDDRLQTKEREQKWEAITDMRRLPMVYKKCSGRRDGSAQLAGYARRFLTTFAPRFDKVPLIVLDHARKVKPKNERDHEGRIAAEVNGVCKDIASDHDAVWLSLNQRSSSGAKRKNPRPIDADLFGGEMAREDYDGIFYLYRAWKYRKSQLATAADEREEKEIEARFTRERWEEDHAELGALKVRFGDPSIRRRIRFEAEYTRYVSMRSSDEQERIEPGLGF